MPDLDGLIGPLVVVLAALVLGVLVGRGERE